ncbi:hypothetical protein AMAG_01524 [Allomyces macrogynus ATCC 38327]|uniref:Fungal lipase-type domain-containing protein n=1 Tax=Allomyces macrogynus (strain ATCC 38327) TaxID=578462 RepID=A0A0L0RZ91_ALLM3|nr:hypothetical protein AMAG_01524 [Allomyces macrogynus ATCC 38327]|eukprot:KNE55638.1 hypothetical protein AMAG_01524 [Allomyces macrogynus ATCC 38327]
MNNDDSARTMPRRAAALDNSLATTRPRPVTTHILATSGAAELPQASTVSGNAHTRKRHSIAVANSMVKVHVHPTDPPRPRVPFRTIAVFALFWSLLLAAFAILVWRGMRVSAAIVAVLAVGAPLLVALAISGNSIHGPVAHSLDALLRVLLAISSVVTPVTRAISNWPPVAALAAWTSQLLFFQWFVALLAGDRILRRMLAMLSGKHDATSCTYSLVNAVDPSFQPAGIFDDGAADTRADADLERDLSSVSAPSTSRAQNHLSASAIAVLRAQGIPFYLKTAYSLAVAAKLAYEDLPIVEAELKQAGYDMDSFTPIHYRNTCGFVVAKGRTVIVVFRGTHPMNLSNVLTDMSYKLVPGANAGSGADLGMLHEGFLDALGPVEMHEPDVTVVDDDNGVHDLADASLLPPPKRRPSADSRRESMVEHSYHRVHASLHRAAMVTIAPAPRIVRVELDMQNLIQAVASSLRALSIIMELLVSAFRRAVSDPIEPYTTVENREESAYVQAHRGIAACVEKIRRHGTSDQDGVLPAHLNPLMARTRGSVSPSMSPWETGVDSAVEDMIGDLHGVPRKTEKPIRLFIAGHSLGGAIANVFLAKVTESRSPFLRYLNGLYTYGSPRVGDAKFQEFMHAHHPNKLFRVVYSKDMVPRVIPIRQNKYAELPGHLVSLSPLGKMVFRPPGTVIRSIDFLVPAGLLSPAVIVQLRNESFLRLVYRMTLPFFVNDHFPSDYIAVLQKYAL